MKRLTQEAWVRTQLERHGRVSRNIALRRYISRLAARIADLRAEGMHIVGRRVKNEYGTDYIYELVK